MDGGDKSKERLVEELEALRQRAAELENERDRSEALFHSLVDSLPDVIYRLDSQGNILFISDGVRRYGHDPEALIGKSIFELVHPEDREKSTYRVNERRTGDRRTQALQLRLLTGSHDPVTFEFKGSEQEVEPTLMVNAEGIYSSERPQAEGFVCTQGVARDITDRVKAEQALREAERVKVFTETAGAAAHEINQPLMVIMGMLQMMLEDAAADDPQRKEFEELLSAAERITGIVREMQTAHRYVTKPYLKGRDIADFEASSQEEGNGGEGA
jgi:two-component system, cell cycle sensor histidine kinase and response regulator CckA